MLLNFSIDNENINVWKIWDDKQCYFLKIKKSIIALSRSECNLNNNSKIRYYIKKYKPGIIINAAAFTDVNECEKKKNMQKQ